MPEIRRTKLPPALLAHLLGRIRQRQISPDQLGLLAAWIDTRPGVPAGPWFKRFPGMTLPGCSRSSWRCSSGMSGSERLERTGIPMNFGRTEFRSAT